MSQRVKNAHHLVAIYIANEPALTDAHATHDDVRNLFDHIMDRAITNPLPPELDHYRSQFVGAVIGICIAGVLRYAQRSDEQAEKRQRRFTLAMNLISIAVGNAVFPSAGAAASVISLAADPIARHAFAKRGSEFTQRVMSLGGDLEVALRRGATGVENGDAACKAMQEVVHRCGYPF